MRGSDVRRELRTATAQLLGSLGGSPPEIATRLGDLGVRGVPANSRRCVVAEYLSAVVAADPRVDMVKVTTRAVRVRPARGWGRPITVGLPPPLRAFINEFDRGAHPDLVREELQVRPPQQRAASDPSAP